jgi:molybdopterin converting factor small subunit
VALHCPVPADHLFADPRELTLATRQRGSVHDRLDCNMSNPAEPVVVTRVASPLRSYTDGRSTVEARGSTVRAVLADLDRRYPGMRFRMIDEQDRIRPHIRLFVNTAAVADLDRRVDRGDTLHLICALSGG